MKNMKKFIGLGVGFSLTGGVFLLVTTFIAIVICGLMCFFGFEYTSHWSGIFYIILVSIISYPIETIVVSLPKALMKLGKINPFQKRALTVVLDTLCIASIMVIVDSFMDSVSATYLSIFIIAISFALLSLKYE